jgi:hypothetical protein
MKTFITVMSLTAFAATSVMAQAPKFKAVRTNLAHIYQSDAHRDFGGEYFYSRVY